MWAFTSAPADLFMRLPAEKKSASTHCPPITMPGASSERKHISDRKSLKELSPKGSTVPFRCAPPAVLPAIIFFALFIIRKKII
jgi:hypothetical protein